MTYAEYRAQAIALAQSVDWGRPPRPGQPWPKRYLPLSLVRHLRLGMNVERLADQYGCVQVEDSFVLRAYFDAKEKNQNRNLFP